jgi:threonylcarbamoyladenosine tRNA methylthiotransferase MtaB
VRTGTTAAKLDGRVPARVIAARARRLREIAARKKVAFAARFDGASAEVVVETTRERATGELRGYTRNYLRARLDGPDAWMGRRLSVRLSVSPAGEVTAAA